MACEAVVSEYQTQQERDREIREILAGLEKELGAGVAQIVIGPNGELTFVGWEDNRGMTDACAYRRLLSAGSWELRQALASAETCAGRAVSEQAIGSGVHSHDGGRSWVSD